MKHFKTPRITHLRKTLFSLTMSSPGLLYCLIGCTCAIVGKFLWIGTQEWTISAGDTLFLMLSDITVFTFLAAFFIAFENYKPALKILTTILALPLCTISMLNALWLTVTGSQVALSVFALAIDDPAQSFSVAVEEISVGDFIALFFCVAGPLILYLVTIPLRRKLPPVAKKLLWNRIGVLLGISLISLMISQSMTKPEIPSVRSVARNVQIDLLQGFISSARGQGGKKFYLPKVHLNDVPADAPKYNVVHIMLESCGHKRSSFGDPEADRTPFWRELAEQGLLADNMRAVVPHSSKTTFSAICGVYPAMQRRFVAYSDNVKLNCLPNVLKKRGYSTVYFQSANGGFEGRPRLVRKMGYQEYYSREQLHAEVTTFINGDDFALLPPARKWIQSHQDKPFMITFFTSLQHISYDYPKYFKKKRCKGTKKECQEERFTQMYEDVADKFLHKVFDILKQTGELDNTIIVVHGDHGEAFGEHGLWIHDNVYFEEGLKIPLVIWAPDLIKSKTVVNEPRSLIDLYPTVLSLLQIPFDKKSMPGLSLLEKQKPDAKRYFKCWYDDYCEGYVQGNLKVVSVPKDQTYFSYDLAADPLELNPIIEDPALSEEIVDLTNWMNIHGNVLKPKYKKKYLYGIWQCTSKYGRCKLNSKRYVKAITKKFKPAKDEGLAATYFKTRKLEGESVEQLDHFIDFHWDKTPPLKEFSQDDFSIRWEGCIVVKEDETPTLVAGSNDGMRVYINNKRVINNWGRHSYKNKEMTKPLQPGVHQIKVEFNQYGKYAKAFLGWKQEGSDLLEMVPPSRLVPPGGNSNYSCPE